MNVLIQLSHPAHFHLYKNVAHNLMKDGHKVFILIKTKDILEDLLKQSGLPYYNILKEAHRKSKLGMFWDMLVRDGRILRFVKKHKIDLLTGSTVEVAQVGWLTRKYRVNTGEDDMNVVPLFPKMAGPFMGTILSPIKTFPMPSAVMLPSSMRILPQSIPQPAPMAAAWPLLLASSEPLPRMVSVFPEGM